MATLSSDDVKVELELNGTWTDVTSYVLVRDGISVREGSSSETTKQPDLASCSLTLDNRDGRFSPRNPSGAYYGTLTRNTPLRVSRAIGVRSTYLFTGGGIRMAREVGQERL